jgi:hypothetical protein
MNPEIISYRGWGNTLRLANNDIELLVTTDVGPRILVYKTPLGENVLKTFDDQLGSSGAFGVDTAYGSRPKTLCSATISTTVRPPGVTILSRVKW